jgi:hypothetical protein
MQNGFFEAVLDLDAYASGIGGGITASECFNNVFVTSRSSDGTTSDIKDFVGLPLTTCGTARIVKNTTGGNGTFTFTVTGPSIPSGVTTVVTTSGNTGSALVNDLLGGTYTVVETLPAGWVSGDISLTKTVAVTVGSTGTVTFNNLQLGNLQIVKNTTGGNGTFTFTTTGPSTVPVQTIVTVGGPPGSGQTPLFTGVLPGTYTVTETLPAGWVSNDELTKTVEVAGGGTGVVTFNNTAQGNLRIVKNTTGGNGTFTFTTTGPSTVPVQTIVSLGGPPGSGTTPLITGVLPGTYTVTETLPTGWITNDTLTKTVSVGIGQTGVVTFNNTAQGNLRIVKNTTGGNGEFMFTTTGPSAVPVQTIVTVGNTGTTPLITGILPGTYTVSVTLPAGWIPNVVLTKTVSGGIGGTGVVSFINTAVG